MNPHYGLPRRFKQRRIGGARMTTKEALSIIRSAENRQKSEKIGENRKKSAENVKNQRKTDRNRETRNWWGDWDFSEYVESVLSDVMQEVDEAW